MITNPLVVSQTQTSFTHIVFAPSSHEAVAHFSNSSLTSV